MFHDGARGREYREGNSGEVAMVAVVVAVAESGLVTATFNGLRGVPTPDGSSRGVGDSSPEDPAPRLGPFGRARIGS